MDTSHNAVRFRQASSRAQQQVYSKQGMDEIETTQAALKIDGEFQALIPPLTPEEKRQLEENMVAEGCRDALVVWEGIILDGHNRFEICQRLDISYQTVEIELPDREAAADWIDRNQLGRRNLTADQMSLLRGRLYNRAKKTKAEAGAIGGLSKGQNDTCLPSTAESLGIEHGVSLATIKRDGQLADAVEKVKPYVPDIVSRVMSGDIPSRQAVIEAASEPEAAPAKLKQHVANNSGGNEWFTPPEYIAAVRRVMGDIDIDPASCAKANETVKARVFYTKENSSLDKPWGSVISPVTVFLNPPYSKLLTSQFINKICTEYSAGHISQAIVLTRNSTDTVWFRELVDSASTLVFTANSQGKAEGLPQKGQAFFYYGDNPEVFIKEFLGFGWAADLPASRKRTKRMRRAVVYGVDEPFLPLFSFANGVVKETGASALA